MAEIPAIIAGEGFMKCFLFVPLLCISLSCTTATAGPQDAVALKNVFKKDFLVGAALTPAQFSESIPADCEVVLIKKHFNSISPENVLKWESVHPRADQYNFGPADRYVDFGVKNNMFIIGHNLVWHNQTPGWVFTGLLGAPLNRETLLQRMHDQLHSSGGPDRISIALWPGLRTQTGVRYRRCGRARHIPLNSLTGWQNLDRLNGIVR
jgi:endo-1,4-beta-xylanase